MNDMVFIEIYDVNHASVNWCSLSSWISVYIYEDNTTRLSPYEFHGHTSETVIMIIDDFLVGNHLVNEMKTSYISLINDLRQDAVDHPNCYWEVEYLDSPEIVSNAISDYSELYSFYGIQPTSFSDFVKYPAVLTIQRCFRGFMGRRIAREKKKNKLIKRST